MTRLVERQIRERGLGPGSRLPTERQLAEAAGVGRWAVRRALGVMEAQGRLVRHVGRGTYLAPVPGDDGVAAAEAEFTTSPLEIMMVRAVFEPQLMALAAVAATAADFSEMERCLRGGATAADYLEWEAWDKALHSSLVASTHNRFLIHIGEVIAAARTQPGWGGLKSRNFSETRREQYRADHQHIVQALIDRDPANANRMMHLHLRRVRSHLLGDAQEAQFAMLGYAWPIEVGGRPPEPTVVGPAGPLLA
ncbi:MAG: FadR/GntR family transcriptional regulator [Candidatus Dormibacteria bacterium]